MRWELSFIWGKMRTAAQEISTSDNSVRLLQRGSGGRSVSKILVKGKFSAFKPFGGYSVAKLCLTLCDPMECSMPAFPVLYHLLEFTPTHVHRVSDAIQPFHFCHPILLLPSIFPGIRVFSNEPILPTRWPKYWSFSLSISPSNKYSGLVSFGIA